MILLKAPHRIKPLSYISFLGGSSLTIFHYQFTMLCHYFENDHLTWASGHTKSASIDSISPIQAWKSGHWMIMMMMIMIISTLTTISKFKELWNLPCLSPVSTQILIPANAKLAIVSGTPSWSLSSMAVAPSRVRFFSISSNKSFNFSSRFSSEILPRT